MSNIRVDLSYAIADGSEVVFSAPCNCNEITGLKVYHSDGSKVFTFKDAHGNNLTGIGNLFSKGALVKAILDVTNGYAFLQNADTNAYLEGHIQNKENPHGVTAAQVKARPDTWNPSFLTDAGNSSYRGGLQYSGSPTNPTYMAVWDTDTSASGTQPNIRVRSINAEGARGVIGAASTAVATQSANGLLSAADKKKLDGIATGANAYTHPTTSGNKHIPSGGSSGQILRWSADGTATWGWDSTGINREFGQALSVSSGTTWTYYGNASKFYNVTVQIGTTAYSHTFVVDWAAVDAASNKQIGYYSDAMGKQLNLVVSISGSSISFKPSGCNIVHICGYY